MLKFLFLLGCLCLSACATQTSIMSPDARIKKTAHLTKKMNWKEYSIRTDPFTLKAYGQNTSGKSTILTIYLEGDGMAWLTKSTPSTNPTPQIPTALKMAFYDKTHHPLAYLARPCQFVMNNEWHGCHQAYWTNLRFSPEVIKAMNEAVTKLKNYYHAKQIILIGYSGGGTIATLIAARRTDVAKLITVAAILDMKQWIDQESLSPMNGSLDPAQEWKNLLSIPQTHWVGGKDTIVRKEVAFAFANHFPIANRPEIKVIPNFDHACCWTTIHL